MKFERRIGAVPCVIAAAVLAATTAVVTDTATASPRQGHEVREPTASESAKRSGWILPAVASIHGDKVFTTYGTHCGTSRFGVYRIIGGVTDHGVQSSWTYDVAITEDGALHKARNVTFTDYTPPKVRKKVRRIFAKTKYHYAVIGQEVLEGLYADGTQQAMQPFAPRPGRC